MDCGLPGSSVHGVLQLRILEWVAISFSRGSSWSRDQVRVSCIEAGSLPTELQGKPKVYPCCCRWKDFILFFNSWIIFCCVYTLHLLYPFIYPWSLRFLPCQRQRGSFSSLSCEKLVGFLEVKSTWRWGCAKTMAPGVSLLTSLTLHLQPFIKVTMKVLLALEDCSLCSREGDLSWDGLDSPVSPDLGVVICPMTLILW